ncbi:MAG: radical SAM protein [Candidatus Omnitrophota bacterium]|nr:radical SAM protein [Candidatus Omnitrophota bacterium]
MKDVLNVFRANYSFRQKMNYLKYRFSAKEETLGYEPIVISVVATGRCTLSCDMCPTHSKKMPKDYPHIQSPSKDISFEDFKRAVDALPRALHVHIIGSGEPLLNRDFFRIAEYAAVKKRMKVKTFSNGTTIEKNIDNIINSPLDGITISLNGHSPEEFSRMTGCPKETYSRIYDATARLIKARDSSGSKVKVKLSFIIDRVNYVNMPLMIETGERLGADSIFFCNFLPAPYKGFTADERMIFTYDLREIDFMRGVYSRLDPVMKKKISLPDAIDPGRTKNGCNTYFTQIRIDGEGRASSCSIMLLNMKGSGRVWDYGVWNNAFFRNMRKTFLSDSAGLLPEPCRVCPENKGVILR